MRAHPYLTPVSLHNLPADRQAETCAGILSSMNPPERPEDGLAIQGVDTRTIVFHLNLPAVPFGLSGDADHRGRFTTELEGIADQMLQYLRQPFQAYFAPDARI
jgi:hypothetical protein